MKSRGPTPGTLSDGREDESLRRQVAVAASPHVAVWPIRLIMAFVAPTVSGQTRPTGVGPKKTFKARIVILFREHSVVFSVIVELMVIVTTTWGQINILDFTG